MPGSVKIAIGTLVTCGLAALLLPVQVAGATVPARSGFVFSAFTHVATTTTTTIPHTRIKTDGSASVFDPTALSTTWSGPVQKTCTSKRQVLDFVNKTATTQKITYLGSVIGKLKAGDEAGICFWGTGSEQFVFGLQNQSSTLTVSVS
ncbi:MAG: hypothetical protein WAM97_18755 [Acidimicrobiales bacterium]